jgi:ComF family protein
MGWTHKRCIEKNGVDGLTALYEYKEPIMKEVVDAIKFGFNKKLIGLILKDFKFEIGESFDALVPVPLYFYRENWRGFNQAEEIAKEFGRQMSLPVEIVLKRIRMTKQQATMKTRKEREENIKDAFVIEGKWKEKLRGKKVLLVDDVFTSGADLRECTKVLKKVGVSLVWGLVLSH